MFAILNSAPITSTDRQIVNEFLIPKEKPITKVYVFQEQEFKKQNGKRTFC